MNLGIIESAADLKALPNLAVIVDTNGDAYQHEVYKDGEEEWYACGSDMGWDSGELWDMSGWGAPIFPLSLIWLPEEAK